MSSLSDLIEQYLREQLARAESIEIQRRQLARMFRCVPSQINYVLETRFNIHRGYLVHSRRGGGGFIRITRINWEPHPDLPRRLEEIIGGEFSQEEMDGLLYRLVEAEVLSENEAILVESVIQQELTGVSGKEADILRARLLRVALLTLCHQDYSD
ncbi:MAG: CtsR family transcriptional regulator [Firmicutes bacterium]|nr:CtsR family transcriptional regulator [Bacillota bacterium]